MNRRTLIVATLVSMILVLTLAPAFAASPFKVDSTTPADGAIDVPLNSDVTVVWNRNVDCTTVTTTSVTIAPDAGGWTRSSCFANQAVFTTSDQAPLTDYNVIVTKAVKDTGGVFMKNAYSMSYTTADVPASPPGYAVVAKTGGDYSDPVAAMGDVAAWCGTPSADNPCLLKIRPGTYDIGAGTLFMQDYVDIEGSGEQVTVIAGNVTTDAANPTAAVLVGASNAEVRSLTIENTGYLVDDAVYPFAALCAGTSPVFSHVTLKIDDESRNARGLSLSGGAAPVLRNVTIQVSATFNSVAVTMTDSAPTMDGVDMSAAADWNARAINSNSSSSIIRDSRANCASGIFGECVWLTGGTTAMTNVDVVTTRNALQVSSIVTPTVVNLDRCTVETLIQTTNYQAVSVGPDATVRIGASKINGPVANLGSLVCGESYDGNYLPLDANCQPLP